MVDVAIVGASGYTGQSLMGILSKHPAVTSVMATSGTLAGQSIAGYLQEELVVKDVSGIPSTLEFIPFDVDAISGCDVVFLAVPHGKANGIVSSLMDAVSGGVRSGPPLIIDMTADHRLGHIYGLPEFHQEEISEVTSGSTQLIANPGCYATASLLATLPLKDSIDSLVLHGISGYSGGGKNHTYKTGGNAIAYKLTSHNHLGEMDQMLGLTPVFVPHVVDAFRGIMVTAVVTLKKGVEHTSETLRTLYSETYANTLTSVVDGPPQLTDVVGTPFCLIGGFEEVLTRGTEATGVIGPLSFVIVSVIDNLMKGAASQAVENMNIALGLRPGCGLLPSDDTDRCGNDPELVEGGGQ